MKIADMLKLWEHYETPADQHNYIYKDPMIDFFDDIETELSRGGNWSVGLIKHGTNFADIEVTALKSSQRCILHLTIKRAYYKGYAGKTSPRESAHESWNVTGVSVLLPMKDKNLQVKVIDWAKYIEQSGESSDEGKQIGYELNQIR